MSQSRRSWATARTATPRRSSCSRSASNASHERGWRPASASTDEPGAQPAARRDRRARPAHREPAQRARGADACRRSREGVDRTTDDSRSGPRARGAAARVDLERGPHAPGRPPRGLPPADCLGALARGRRARSTRTGRRRATGAARRVTPPAGIPPTTRFAPAPTGRLHLGHLANAIYVWGLARRRGGRVLLRIEDHDRQRCRPEFETALLDDLDRLGLVADAPSTDELRAGPSRYRQSDNDAAYAAALVALRAQSLAYACDCTRSTFDAWHSANGRAWAGPGCPGGCRERDLSIDRALTESGTVSSGL